MKFEVLDKLLNTFIAFLLGVALATLGFTLYELRPGDWDGYSHDTTYRNSQAEFGVYRVALGTSCYALSITGDAVALSCVNER